MVSGKSDIIKTLSDKYYTSNTSTTEKLVTLFVHCLLSTQEEGRESSSVWRCSPLHHCWCCSFPSLSAFPTLLAWWSRMMNATGRMETTTVQRRNHSAGEEHALRQGYLLALLTVVIDFLLFFLNNICIAVTFYLLVLNLQRSGFKAC